MEVLAELVNNRRYGIFQPEEVSSEAKLMEGGKPALASTEKGNDAADPRKRID